VNTGGSPSMPPKNSDPLPISVPELMRESVRV
jgi:hypothetical protein